MPLKYYRTYANPKVLSHLYHIASNFRNYKTSSIICDTIIAMELKFRKYWENLSILFSVAYVMALRYIQKIVITQISNMLNFETSMII